MATLAISTGAVVVRGKESNGYWGEKIRNIVDMLKSASGPFLAAGNLDYMETSYRSTLTASEKAVIDGDLMGITTH